MQRKSTTKPAAKASPEVNGVFSALLEAESQLIGLSAMSRALSELLELDTTHALAKVQRQMAAAFQVSWALEDMAEAALELVRDAQIFEGQERQTGEVGKDEAHAIDRKSRPPSEVFERLNASFRCDYDDMVGFVDDLVPLVDLMKILQVGLEGAEPFDAYGSQVFASNMGTVISGAERLLASMHRCFDYSDGRPDRRHDRAAKAGAA